MERCRISRKRRRNIKPAGHIGPTAPNDLANKWIPTAGRGFWLIADFDGTDKTLFQKDAGDADVEKVS